MAHIADSDNRNLHDEAILSAFTLKQINKINESYAKEYIHAVADVKRTMSEKGIRILNDKEVNDQQKSAISALYTNQLSGNILPVWLQNIEQMDNENDDYYLS